MRLKRRAFVKKLDFLTSPGHLTGHSERLKLGLPGMGPRLVVTDKCTFIFDEETGEMTLSSLYPGLSLEEVQAEVEWPMQITETVTTSEPPSEQEIQILRQELDPMGIYR